VTAAGVRTPPGAPAARRWPSAGPGPRLARLYLASRRVPAGLLTLAVCAAALRGALYWHWTLGGSAAAAQQLPVLIEAGTAGLIAVTTYSPFGEPERATGRWLPWLRLGTAVALTATAIGALAAGAAAEHLDGGVGDVLRNVAGMTGIGLLSAVVVGGALAWIGPMAYLLLAELALAGGWTTPWTWPARSPHDVGAALCAAGVFAAGAAVTAVRGARSEARAG
jgi:hypothetical protein